MPTKLLFHELPTSAFQVILPYLLRFLPCLLLGVISGYVSHRLNLAREEGDVTQDDAAASVAPAALSNAISLSLPAPSLPAPSLPAPSPSLSPASPPPNEPIAESSVTADTIVYGALPLAPTAHDLPRAVLSARADLCGEISSERADRTNSSKETTSAAVTASADGAALLEKFQQAVLHDFINRLRNRYPDEPNRFLSRLMSEQMVADLRDYLDRLIPKHTEALSLRPKVFGLVEMLPDWERQIRTLSDFLDWSKGLTIEDLTPNETAHWTSKLADLVLYLEKLQESIIKNVGLFTVDLADLLDEVDGLYPEVRLSIGLALTIRHSGGEGLADSLKAVFCNLCDNALNAGAKEIVITAKRDKESGAIAVTLSDDGAGLPDPSASNLFLTGVGAGTGTGLSKVRKIIRKIGGTVVVGTPVNDMGATFVLSLPRKVGELK